jgi:F-type H+-transporting ATPase subunit a
MGGEALHHVVFAVGPLVMTRTVVLTWLIMALLVGASVLLTRRLSLAPGLLQTMTEGVVMAIEDAVRAVLPEHSALVLPFVGTLWIFLLTANLTGLVPGLNSPTSDLSTTAALAALVFLSVHWFGMRAAGIGPYLKHYLTPSPVLLPFHIIGEVTRTLALAVRLFGNIMSMEIAALLMLSVAGLVVPIPILMLHIVEALVQAYIFGVLAMVYIAGGILTRHTRSEPRSMT